MSLIDDLQQCHIDEPCPKCGAESGEKCRTSSGKPISGRPHAGRIYNGNILFRERQQSGYYDRSTTDA